MAHDVIVIGAGGGGPVMAKELAAQGLSVLLLEAGPHFDDPESQWTHLENDANNPLSGYFRMGPGDRAKPAWYGEWPQNSFVWQLAGVGGTTLHYYGNSPRAMPGVFMGYEGPDATAYDTAHPFPFTYEELLPYYRWVEATLPVETAAMGTKEERFFAGAAGMGLPLNTDKNVTADSYRPQENAILQPRGQAAQVTGTADDPALQWPNSWGCTFCGYCFQGCYETVGAPINLKAKRSTNVSYVPMALTAGTWAASTGGKDVTLQPNAFVSRIHTAQEGGETVAKAVTWRDTDTGDEHTEEAAVIVMAGGCTQNPRLWLNSGLPNPNGWVGRGYTDHFFDWVVGRFDDDTNSSRGVGSSARADFPGRGGLENVGLPPALQVFSQVFSQSGIRGHYKNGRGPTGPWDGDAGRMMANTLKRFTEDIDKLLNVLVITDDDVEAQNRVTLSALDADEHGPVPKIQFHARNRTKRTLDNREFLAQRAAELLRAAGAKEVIRIDWPPLILHVQSTMRMGLDESNSVLDENAQSRWVKGLYVADNSALANALGGPNPTLTTQAMVTRTAEKIFVNHFGGEAWVGDGSGALSSIDQSVTDAVLAAGMAEGAARGGEVIPATGGGGTGALPLAAAGAAVGLRQLIRFRERGSGPSSSHPEDGCGHHPAT